MRSNVNVTVDERDTDMGGGAVFHDNRVDIEPSTAGREQQRLDCGDRNFYQKHLPSIR